MKKTIKTVIRIREFGFYSDNCEYYNPDTIFCTCCSYREKCVKPTYVCNKCGKTLPKVVMFLYNTKESISFCSNCISFRMDFKRKIK